MIDMNLCKLFEFERRLICRQGLYLRLWRYIFEVGCTIEVDVEVKLEHGGDTKS